MTLENKKKYVVIFSLIIILDQVSKFIIKSIFSDNPYKVIHVIKDFFLIRDVEEELYLTLRSNHSLYFVNKPFTINSLAQAVRIAIEGGEPEMESELEREKGKIIKI